MQLVACRTGYFAVVCILRNGFGCWVELRENMKSSETVGGDQNTSVTVPERRLRWTWESELGLGTPELCSVFTFQPFDQFLRKPGSSEGLTQVGLNKIETRRSLARE